MKFFLRAHAGVNGALGRQLPCLFRPDRWNSDDVLSLRSLENGIEDVSTPGPQVVGFVSFCGVIALLLDDGWMGRRLAPGYLLARLSLSLSLHGGIQTQFEPLISLLVVLHLVAPICSHRCQLSRDPASFLISV